MSVTIKEAAAQILTQAADLLSEKCAQGGAGRLRAGSGADGDRAAAVRRALADGYRRGASDQRGTVGAVCRDQGTRGTIKHRTQEEKHEQGTAEIHF